MSTKTEIREWMRRCRRDLANLEQYLRDDDASGCFGMAEDLTGSAGEVSRLVEDRFGGAPAATS